MMLSANRKVSYQRSNKQVHSSSSSLSKISTPHRLILTSATLAAFTSLPTVDALRNVQKSNLEELIAKKKEGDALVPMASKEKESSNVVSPEPKGYLVPLTKTDDDTTKMEPALPKDFPLMKDLMSHSHGIQDDGEALSSLLENAGPKTTSQDKKHSSLRSKYLKAKKYANHLLHQHQLRQLEDAMEYCNGFDACQDSDPFCIKEGSCNDELACSNSSGLQVEPESCNARGACYGSPGIIVGSESCNEFQSCLQSPGACIGQRSCENLQACAVSPGIQVSTDACNSLGACALSPGALIDQQSCSGGGNFSCFQSPNITVDQFSCNDELACVGSPGAIIGKYACNCYRCCLFLEPNCSIPNYACNGGNYDCSYGIFKYGTGNYTLGCPFN